MTDIQPYLDRLDITLTEYPEDPWGWLEGRVFCVRGKWREDAQVAPEEAMVYMALGRGTTRDEAIQDFRADLADEAKKVADIRRQVAIEKNPTSVVRITL